jgi:hypothetical protein
MQQTALHDQLSCEFLSFSRRQNLNIPQKLQIILTKTPKNQKAKSYAKSGIEA